MEWNVFACDKATGIRRFLGSVESDTPLQAIRMAAEFYEYDAKDLIVSHFIPWGYPFTETTIESMIAFTHFVTEETLAFTWWYTKMLSLWFFWLT